MSLTYFCSSHSDMSMESLEFLENSFRMAHKQFPGGLSIEVGSRKGGSALLMLMILQELYPDATRPMLFTIDPYGGKPYQGGDALIGGLYGDQEYRAMKRLLCEFPNHVHWYLESSVFLRVCTVIRYWKDGLAHSVKGIHFALLDGDHACSSIEDELSLITPLIGQGAVLLIDNVDRDPLTIPMLERTFGRDKVLLKHTGNPGETMARIILTQEDK